MRILIFKELLKAETWIKVHRIPFPVIDEEDAMKDGVHECYVFEIQAIRSYFTSPLVNNKFRQFKEPGKNIWFINSIFGQYSRFFNYDLINKPEMDVYVHLKQNCPL